MHHPHISPIFFPFGRTRCGVGGGGGLVLEFEGLIDELLLLAEFAFETFAFELALLDATLLFFGLT